MRQLRTPLFLAGVLIACVVPAEAAAQDRHYWTRVFGPEAFLLSGPVVAEVRDSGAVVNNPGALGFAVNADLTLAADTLSYESVTYEDGAGAGFDLTSSSAYSVPSMTSGIFGLGGGTFGFAIVTPQDYRSRLQAANQGITETRQEFAFTTQFNEETELREAWFGAGWGRRIRDNFGVGASVFVAVRRNRFTSSSIGRALGLEETEIVTVDLFADTSYTHVGLLAKLGAAYETERWKLGGSITTPRARIHSTGEIAANATLLNTDLNQDGSLERLIVDGQEKDLSATYKSPWAIAGGAGYTLSDRWSVSAAAEWFSSIGEYTILDADVNVFVGTDGEIIDAERLFKVSEAADSVLNYRISTSFEASDSVKLHAGYRTNFAFRVDRDLDGISPSTTPWDLRHIAAGMVGKVGSVDLTLGLGYAFGNTDRALARIDVNDPASDFLNRALDEVNASYGGVELLVGFRANIGGDE